MSAQCFRRTCATLANASSNVCACVYACANSLCFVRCIVFDSVFTLCSVGFSIIRNSFYRAVRAFSVFRLLCSLLPSPFSYFCCSIPFSVYLARTQIYVCLVLFIRMDPVPFIPLLSMLFVAFGNKRHNWREQCTGVAQTRRTHHQQQ